MGVKVSNNAFGTLSAGISTSDTTVTLDSGQGARFPTLGAGDYFYGTIVDTSNNLEIVKVTARSTDSMTVTRAQDDTTATAFAIGDRFELRPTAALFDDLQSQIDNVDLSSRVAKTGDTMTGRLEIHNSTETGYASNISQSSTRSTISLRGHATDSPLVVIGSLDAGVNGAIAGAAYIQRTNGTSSWDLHLQPFGGRVLTPNQPSFYARGNGGWTVFSNGSDSTIALTVTDHNTGNHYSTSTSTFTSPVAGRYIFTMGMYARPQGGQGDNSTYWQGGFLKNGTRVNSTAIVGYQNDGDYDNNHTQSVVISLAANDTVKVWGRAAGSYNGEAYLNNCFFSGHLLG